MTNPFEDRYEGAYLDALDLPEGVEVPVTIESIAEPFAEKDSHDPPRPIKSAIISFVGKKKRLILNKTNFKNLKAMFSKDPKSWIGQTIKIQRRYLDAQHGFGVNNTLAIRIIPPLGTPILKSAASFMGSPTPYGRPTQQPSRPKQAPPEPADQPAPPDPDSGPPDELAQWLTGIGALESLETCAEFREQMIPVCPEAIRPQVEQAILDRENSSELYL